MMKLMQLTVPQEVETVLRQMTGTGYEVSVVGGAVRDLLMGRKVADWDFTTNATPEEILGVFPDGFYDNRFGTVGVQVKTGGEIGTEGLQEDRMRPFEITTFRSESEYSDSRRPDRVVWGKSLKEDLLRRDFTINAMALKNRGAIFQGKPIIDFELIDLFGGQEDLQNKVVRAVGNPDERFGEDALRMMRAIRIASELGFLIEPATFTAICDNAKKIAEISWERIRDELFKTLRTEYVYDGLMLLRNSGILEIVLPEANTGFGVEQASPGRHHIYDVGTHSFLAAKFCPSYDPLVRLATLLHDSGKPTTSKVLPNGTITFYNHEVAGAQIAYKVGVRLKLSKDQIKKLVTLVRWHMFSVDDRQTDSAIRRFMRRVGKENISDMLALRTGDRLSGGARETSWRLEKYKERIEQLQLTPFSVSDMAVDGRDVMDVLGIGPGPRVGEVLGKLFDEVMEDHEKNKREHLLTKIQGYKI